MDMQVIDRLAAVNAAIYHHSVARLQPQVDRDPVGHEEQVAQEGRIASFGFGQRRNFLAGND
jgi:hypothetical protein